LGRRDDLWSLFYVLIEFAQGILPWRKLREKEEIGEIKIQHNNRELVKDLPPEFGAFMSHLKGLDYSDCPDYAYLYTLLSDLYFKMGGTPDTPLDWDSEG
jgi:tau tubulin kinase